MIPEQMFNLYSKDIRYYGRYLSGLSKGRRVKVWDLARNYFNQFRSIATYLFSYEGLTQKMQRKLEDRLFIAGRCGIVQHEGTLISVDASPYGEDIDNEPTDFTFNFGGGIPDRYRTPNQRKIGVDGVLCRNSWYMVPTALIVEQYALMLAHVDMSIIVECVNGRLMDVIIARTNKDVEEAELFTRRLYEGELKHLTDRAEEMEINRTSRGVSNLKDLLDTKDRLLKDIYAFFGIKKISEKRERMITGEVEASEKLLLFNLKDMLEMRKMMCEDIKQVFGVEIKVKCHVDIDGSGALEHEQEMEEEEKNE